MALDHDNLRAAGTVLLSTMELVECGAPLSAPTAVPGAAAVVLCVLPRALLIITPLP